MNFDIAVGVPIGILIQGDGHIIQVGALNKFKQFISVILNCLFCYEKYFSPLSQPVSTNIHNKSVIGNSML